ncbi:MAG: hypothetical protein HKN17_10585 [Rhodothermales bacterium]|nr:hypothetical protein [Rhodothermales bacterium]
MTDLFVIDYGPMEDLMFWGRFGRLLGARGADAPPALIFLGSGERVQGQLGGPGAAPRTNGELPSDPDRAARLERGMREDMQSVVATLTDEGISAVGFCGVDRNFLRFDEKTESVDEEGFNLLRIGRRALESAIKWTDRGVIPVVSCLAGTPDRGVRDVHPAAVAASVAETLTNTRTVFVAQRLTSGLRSLLSDPKSTEIALSDLGNALAEPIVASQLLSRLERVHITHPDLRDLRRPPRIVHS